MKPLLVVIGGPTGIGKTSTGIKLAQHFKTEILSADSRQFYKELKIGTAVPTEKEQSLIKHHFIHNLSIDDEYNASQYEIDALTMLNDLFKKHDIVIMVGGSGLYIDAVCSGIDYLPTINKEVREKYNQLFLTHGIEEIRRLVEKTDSEYYKKVDKNNPKRMLKALEVYETTGLPYSSFLKNTKKERDFDVLMLLLDTEREELYGHINLRVDKMIESGLIKEASNVYSKRELTPLKTVGYKELFEYFDGSISEEEAIIQIKNHTRAYARRQLTWFRRYKDGFWSNTNEIEKMILLINERL